MKIISLFLKFFKAVAYGVFAFFMYTDFIGPEGIADILGVSKNIDQYDTEKGALILSEGLIKSTIAAAVLEVVDNLLEMIPRFKKD